MLSGMRGYFRALRPRPPRVAVRCGRVNGGALVPYTSARGEQVDDAVKAWVLCPSPWVTARCCQEDGFALVRYASPMECCYLWCMSMLNKQ
jgi:hypothetical protein